MICSILIDNSWKAGNKQPTFFDAILSSTGPYKNYYVESWETTWTVVNMTSVPVRMYVAPALNVSTEVDSQTEAENFPGVVIRYYSQRWLHRTKCQ